LVRTYLAPSPIHGIGCYASQFIAAGTPVWRFVPCFDQLLHPSFCREMCDPQFIEKYAQLCPLTGYWLLCADEARYINHDADAPNLGAAVPLADPTRTDRALRDIDAHEEITCNYEIGDVQPYAGFRERVAA